MALFVSFMRLRGKTWHYRRRVPVELREYFDGLHEFTKSCKSTKQGEARTIRAYYDSEIERICLALRINILTPDEARKKVDDLLNTRKFSDKSNKPAYQSPVVPSIVTLSNVIRLYELKNSDNWTPKTKMEKEGIFRRIKVKFGNKPINSIKQDDVLHWRKELTAGGLGVVTTNKYLSNLSGVMKYAVQQGFLVVNPVEGTALTDKRVASEIRSAYSLDDIRRLFSHLQREKQIAYLKGKHERYWAPLISMYTGLRADECAQLYLEDINFEDLVIKVERGHDKKVKTKSSVRAVPIHPDLLTLGFMNYACKMKDEGHSRLFPGLKRHSKNGYSHELVKWWSRWSRQIITDTTKTFHSFRHTVADRLKQNDVDGVLIAEVLGHEVPSISLARYGKHYSINKKCTALSHLKYGIVPELEVSNHRIANDDEDGWLEDLNAYNYYGTAGSVKFITQDEKELQKETRCYERPDLYGYSKFHQSIPDFLED
ncbi:tyrosine-type recombinase/integrase [Geomonas anaerohicana]|uniref:Site-specific integrase n=1 Tax=Geomonas anaerohicana TaxID=2798583 RepID=A0ABS0YLE0_9BACT|nr:site-specific integrase [Geomonas anaerohicana]MBJ6752702.1 site-specific integrase [Geomonas anaerohicana]